MASLFSRLRLARPIGLLVCLLIAGSGAVDLRAEQEGCYCIGRVGNVDCDYQDRVTLRDIMFLVDHFFITQRRLPNLEEANCNGDPAGEITLGDLSTLIDYLFISGHELPYCPAVYNSPPDTRLVNFNSEIEYVNAVYAGSPVTGVPATWQASDVVDHPHDKVQCEFAYRLYGPYPDAEFTQVVDSFVVPCFQLTDGRVLLMDNKPELDTITWEFHPTWFIVCDTSYDYGTQTIGCDTILVDTITDSNMFGVIDTLFRCDDLDFVASPFNRVAKQSYGWIDDTSTVLYDVFDYYPSDTTWKGNFVLWVRAREKNDVAAVDPTPDFRFCKVIDARHERDVLITNWSNTADENSPTNATTSAYWAEAIQDWVDHTGHASEVSFDPARDYLRMGAAGATTDFLTRLLRYKVVIVSQDAAVTGTWAKSKSLRDIVFTAMGAGVNVWAATRVPLGTYTFGSPPGATAADAAYQYFLGVEQYTFSGWFYYAIVSGVTTRTEDFIGATSHFPELWPELDVDSARLHALYRWVSPAYWDPNYPALAEVDWIAPTPDAEVLYMYKSMYGDEHPVDPSLSFQGLPVMVRVNRGFFRSVQSVFTPISLEQTAAQEMVDSLLNWLYDGQGSEATVNHSQEMPSLTREE